MTDNNVQRFLEVLMTDPYAYRVKTDHERRKDRAIGLTLNTVMILALLVWGASTLYIAGVR